MTLVDKIGAGTALVIFLTSMLLDPKIKKSSRIWRTLLTEKTNWSS
jgi:hypothetical protein